MIAKEKRRDASGEVQKKGGRRTRGKKEGKILLFLIGRKD
jgi:hypothetical protein